MRIPGEKRSLYPDEVGTRAGIFAAAIRDGEMHQAWSMLSKETRGMRLGVWATRNNINLQIAYRAAYDATHLMRHALLADFRHFSKRHAPEPDLKRCWPWSDCAEICRRRQSLRWPPC